MALPYIIMLSLTQIFALAILLPLFWGRVKAEQKKEVADLTEKERKILAIPVEKLANIAIICYFICLIFMTVIAHLYFSKQNWADPWLLTGMFFAIGAISEIPNLTYKKKKYIQQIKDTMGRLK